ncbi:MAG: hypothetical protein P4L40_08690 [Terracidiphilus sp.]|nr:hypothetical protein [Terracidiphilus sp.]
MTSARVCSLPSLSFLSYAMSVLGTVPAQQLLQKIELFFQCRGLPNMDVIGKSGECISVMGRVRSLPARNWTWVFRVNVVFPW